LVDVGLAGFESGMATGDLEREASGSRDVSEQPVGTRVAALLLSMHRR
jgi:hypothetical protein